MLEKALTSDTFRMHTGKFHIESKAVSVESEFMMSFVERYYDPLRHPFRLIQKEV